MHMTNYWVIPIPGALDGCFPETSILQLSSYFGKKPKQQGTSVTCSLMSRVLCTRVAKSATTHAFAVWRVQTLENIIFPSGYRFPGSETYWHHSRVQPKSKISMHALRGTGDKVAN